MSSDGTATFGASSGHAAAAAESESFLIPSTGRSGESPYQNQIGSPDDDAAGIDLGVSDLLNLDQRVLRAVDHDVMTADDGLEVMLAAESFHNKLLDDATRETPDGVDALIAEEENNLMNAMRSGRIGPEQALNELIGISSAGRMCQSTRDEVDHRYAQDDIEAMLATESSDMKGETPDEFSRND